MMGQIPGTLLWTPNSDWIVPGRGRLAATRSTAHGHGGTVFNTLMMYG